MQRSTFLLNHLLIVVSVVVSGFSFSGITTGTLTALEFRPELNHAETDDPIADAERLVQKISATGAQADQRIERASKLKDHLGKAKDLNKADRSSLKLLADIHLYLGSTTDGIDTTLKGLSDSAAELGNDDRSVVAVIDRLNLMPTSAAVEDAKGKMAQAKSLVAAKLLSVNKARDALSEPANALAKALEAILSDLLKQLDEINDQEPIADTLLGQLPRKLAGLTAAHDLTEQISTIGPQLQIAVRKLVPNSTSNPNFSTASTMMKSTIEKLGNWLEVLTANTLEANRKLLDMREMVDDDIRAHSITALKLLDDVEPKRGKLEIIANLSKTLARANESTATEKKAIELEGAVRSNLSRIELLRGGLSGDFRDFVNDFVSLYYFTDVPNLMRVLNPDTTVIRDVSALKEESAARRRDLDRSDLDLSSAAALQASLQIRKRNLVNELKDAENDFLSSSSLLGQAERRLSRYGQDDPSRRAAQERVSDLTVQKSAHEQRYNSLKDENNGLPAKIRDADAKLSEAEKAVETARNNMIMLAQDESVAFAEARDNEPVYYARNDVMSKDPLKQVIIYAFGNRKIIYLRGHPANVERAKNIISFYDRPAPQARLSLWTLELNGLPTVKGTRQFSESLQELDLRLSISRSKIAAVLAILRREINNEVDKVVRKHLDGEAESESNGQETDNLHWARAQFYQPEVLTRLGFKINETNPNNIPKIVSRNALPDPIGAGTLGEALVILSLSKPEYRDCILKEFERKVGRELLEIDKTGNIGKSNKDTKRVSFQLTLKALDLDSNTGYSPFQREIVNSIILASIPRLSKKLDQLSLLAEKPQDLKEPERAKLIAEIENVLDFLWLGYGVSITDLGLAGEPKQAAEQLVDDVSKKRSGAGTLLGEAISRLRNIKRKQNVFRVANAQIAKTDNLLKQLIDAFEEDINREIVQPTIYGLRNDLARHKVSVGIISRTSVLATNRLSARVDARGSAQLSVGQEQDALLAAQQLANLYMAAKTGGLVGGLSGFRSMRQNRDTSEVYGINSGSVFKVTPVFDPSGQALRFQFDHTLANVVTEPDGSVQPAMPRIERHTVNTEVQLSNMELREISRFESNAKLGIPTSYKGGVPIFRDIPYVNKVPLLGWFVRRSGQSAVIQESIVLGQTTMYPTIADIFDLLSGDDYNYESEQTNRNS